MPEPTKIDLSPDVQIWRGDADYAAFLDRKSQLGGDHGFDPLWMPPALFPFQVALVEWALRKGRAAIFADCGLGKTPMQLVWAENVVRKTSGRVLILAPLAVGAQTVREGEKFGVECAQSRDGKLPDGKHIIVTNYEKLHLFKPEDFAACVCDESSILKNFAGATRQAITDFMASMPYRLLCTATAAPNDYIELGTSSEALGYLRRPEMLGMYFVHDGGDTQKWSLKGHAKHPFWGWVCSWARALRMPSDMGFSNGGFELPPLRIREHVVKAATPRDGWLFDAPVVGLDEQRDERRRTFAERCEMAAGLVNATNKPAVCWGYLNPECDLLEKLIPGSVQVSGADSDEAKEEAFDAFRSGRIRVLITKPVIGAWGLNWQHCAHQTFFPSHSFEQYYQAVRRSWRFGQTSPVTVDVIASEGERGVMASIERKSEQADRMFSELVSLVGQEIKLSQQAIATKKTEVPAWL